jgi:chaperonin cofactor prefoldin
MAKSFVAPTKPTKKKPVRVMPNTDTQEKIWNTIAELEGRIEVLEKAQSETKTRLESLEKTVQRLRAGTPQLGW